jgi:hypothetical protein
LVVIIDLTAVNQSLPNDANWPTLTGEPPTTIGGHGIHSCHGWPTAGAGL